MRDFDPFRPGQRSLSAADLNRMADYVERYDRMFGGPGVTVENGPQGPSVQVQPYVRFPAQILSGSGPYAFQEVYWNGTQFVQYPDGRNDASMATPAYELNGSASVAANTFVDMWIAPDQLSYQFSAGGGGGGTPTIYSHTRGGGVSAPQNQVVTMIWTTGYGPFWNSGLPTVFTVPSSQPPGGTYRMFGSIRFLGDDATASYWCVWYQLPTLPNLPVNSWDTAGECEGLGTKLWDFAVMILNPGDQVALALAHNQPVVQPKQVPGIYAEIQYMGTND